MYLHAKEGEMYKTVEKLQKLMFIEKNAADKNILLLGTKSVSVYHSGEEEPL